MNSAKHARPTLTWCVLSFAARNRELNVLLSSVREQHDARGLGKAVVIGQLLNANVGDEVAADNHAVVDDLVLESVQGLGGARVVVLEHVVNADHVERGRDAARDDELFFDSILDRLECDDVYF